MFFLNICLLQVSSVDINCKTHCQPFLLAFLNSFSFEKYPSTEYTSHTHNTNFRCISYFRDKQRLCKHRCAKHLHLIKGSFDMNLVHDIMITMTYIRDFASES
jgi:hypothetical protein